MAAVKLSPAQRAQKRRIRAAVADQDAIRLLYAMWFDDNPVFMVRAYLIYQNRKVKPPPGFKALFDNTMRAIEKNPPREPKETAIRRGYILHAVERHYGRKFIPDEVDRGFKDRLAAELRCTVGTISMDISIMRGMQAEQLGAPMWFMELDRALRGKARKK